MASPGSVSLDVRPPGAEQMKMDGWMNVWVDRPSVVVVVVVVVEVGDCRAQAPEVGRRRGRF